MLPRGARIGLVLLLVISSAVAEDLSDARGHYESGHYRQAKAIAEKVAKEDPENARAFYLLGRVQFLLSDFAGARQSFARAVELAPGSFGQSAAEYQGMIDFHYGNDEKALEWFRKADPEEVDLSKMEFLMNPPDLVSKKAKHYTIYTDQDLADKQGHEYCARVMDLIYQAYRKVFPYDIDPKYRSRVYIFSTESQFLNFSGRVSKYDKSESLGYFNTWTRILVVNADPQDRETNQFGITWDTQDTMFHEGFHQFIRLFAPKIPRWFNEGLAEYFGPSEYLKGRKVAVGRFRKEDPAGRYTRYSRVSEMIAEGQHMPLEKFMNLSNAEFSGEGMQSKNYAQAWAVIHFLMDSKSMRKSGRKMIKKYFNILKEGGTPKEAHAKTFAKLKFDQVEKAWLKYVRGL